MLVQRIRRQGNSLGVTIPKDEVERLGLQEGDLVAVSVNKVHITVQLPDDVRQATETALRDYKADLDYLEHR